MPKKYEAARPFIVTIEEDKRETQNMRYIVDPNFKAKVKLYKIDEETKQTVIQNEAKYGYH